MNRREFIGCATGLMVLPNVKLGDKPKDNSLRFVRMQPNPNFGGPCIKAIKGDRECVFGTSFEGGIDYHNVCATGEMAVFVVQELEFGRDGMSQLYKLSFNEEEKRKELLVSLRTNPLTWREKQRVFALMKMLRGPHKCHSIWRTPESIWGPNDEGLTWRSR